MSDIEQGMQAILNAPFVAPDHMFLFVPDGKTVEEAARETLEALGGAV